MSIISRFLSRRATCWVAPFSILASVASAADFTTSFEADEPVRPFENKTEMTTSAEPMQRNVVGKLANALMDSVVEITASAENGPAESAARAADDDIGTKWLTFSSEGWLQYKLKQNATAVTYSLTSADDHAERDPRDWRLLGSDDGTTWQVLDAQTGQNWAKTERGVTKRYSLASPRDFSHYRLDISANHAEGIVQLSGWALIPAAAPGEKASSMTTVGDSGPKSGYNIKPKVGFTGMRSLQFGGQHTADGPGFATNRLFDVSIPVGKQTRLSYDIFPELTGNDLQYPSTYTAVTLSFSDGTQLADLKPLDFYEMSATARGQGAGKILYPNQWNRVRVDVGSVAVGKTISAIQLAYDNDGAKATTVFKGWLDNITIEANPKKIDGSSLTNYVDTRRGTNSSAYFSRGSNEAITAWPNGFNFIVPVTDATVSSREYSYQSDNDDQNRTRLEGLATCHQPSPWMGDRNQISVMPVAGNVAPSGNPHQRALTFSHDREIAQPDYYSVTTDSGIQAEMTPTNRGFLMRFTFVGEAGSVVLDSPTGDGAVNIDSATGNVTGWVDYGAGFRVGQSRMFLSGKFDQVPTATGLAAGGRGLTKFATFRTVEEKSVTLRLATSLISLEQAARNFDQEVSSQSFAEIREKARAEWNKRLGVIRVEGGVESQLINLYGCLYRLNIYPNTHFENVGTLEKPEYKYASPVSPKVGRSTATTTNATLVSGKMYVNNGFWDTYRTAWPAYALLYPDIAAELIDGFTDQYRAGGWIARWSSPGYANIMTGTSSDVAFADAYLRGVKLPAPLETFAAAIKNASTPSTSQDTGRKGLTTSLFLGYSPATLGESVSWAAEGFVNDFGIGNMATALAADPATPDALRADLRDQGDYYRARSQNYVHLFDPAIGFFQARNADGSFALKPSQFDPTKWFGPYTETNGWNFSFHAPHDPQGLVNLYGGKAKLEAKLDAFFTTPETSPGPIHEEVEARDGRYGQWGVSNQVSHHIPFIYNAVGAPAKCQKLTREVLQRSFTGSEIGQGYSGDEDNGEMSAWFIFNALGLYPVQTGSNQLVVGSPLFPKATVALGNGKTLTINAPGNNANSVYVQSVAVNGTLQTRTSIDSSIFKTGGSIDYVLGTNPSAWGTGPDDGLPSLTQGNQAPKPLADLITPGKAALSSPAGESLASLIDNSSATEVAFKTATPAIIIAFPDGATKPATFYTLTASAQAADPSAWMLEGSNDGSLWTPIDTRKDQTFTHRRETKPLKIQSPGSFQKFRLTISAGAARIALSEIELLTQ